MLALSNGHGGSILVMNHLTRHNNMGPASLRVACHDPMEHVSCSPGGIMEWVLECHFKKVGYSFIKVHVKRNIAGRRKHGFELFLNEKFA